MRRFVFSSLLIVFLVYLTTCLFLPTHTCRSLSQLQNTFTMASLTFVYRSSVHEHLHVSVLVYVFIYQQTYFILSSSKISTTITTITLAQTQRKYLFLFLFLVLELTSSTLKSHLEEFHHVNGTHFTMSFSYFSSALAHDRYRRHRITTTTPRRPRANLGQV